MSNDDLSRKGGGENMKIIGAYSIGAGMAAILIHLDDSDDLHLVGGGILFIALGLFLCLLS